jgi:RHS repeat-associated protein
LFHDRSTHAAIPRAGKQRPENRTKYVYDSLGRVTSKVQTTTASPSNKTFTVGYSYSSGRQTGITYPSGRAITYGFNSQGQVTSVTVDGTTTILSSGEYFPFGGVKKWTWGNGQVNERTFDQDGRVKTLTLGPSTGTYADLSQVFGYDGLNRLTTANLAAGQTQGFTYDANSNRLSATVNASTTTYTYPTTSHKLTSLSGGTTRSFTYDNAGNVTNSQSITYLYDGRGRMKQAGTVTYLVNGLGQRVKKNNGTDNFFVYDEAGRLIGEYDATGAAIQETVWLGDLPVATIRPASPSGFNVFYVWSDQLGSPRLITDTANQSRWEWANSDPFGNNAPNENPAGVGSFTYNLRFPGQYYDVETGKHYNYFRDYDPGTGRYLESDPVGLRGGFNTFSYVRASPLRSIDPRGLFEFDSSCFSCKNDLEDWRNQVGTACRRAFAEIKDPAMRDCIVKRCDDGKIACDGPHCRVSRNRGGYHLAPDDTIQLCASNQSNFRGDSRGMVGCLAIHEWGHSCGWGGDHPKGLGLPGESGSVDPIECAKWR